MPPPPPLPQAASSSPSAPPSAPPSRQDLEDMIRLLAKEHQVDPDLALSIAEVESNFNPRARSNKDARGLMQVMPATAAQYGVTNPDDLDDPVTNITAAMQYLKALEAETGGKPTLIARRYVGSPQLPPEKSDFYVRRVFDRYRQRTGLPVDRNNEDTDGRTPADPDPKGEVDPVRGLAPGGAKIEGAPFFSWAAWPRLGNFLESMDPHERQGRQNIAGALGSIGGGTLGGAIGATVGAAGGTMVLPGGGTAAGLGTGAIWGRRIGSAVGAGLAGAAEQAVIEETPIGAMISSSLPGGTQNDTSRPPPDSTTLGRIGTAAATQAGSDVVGQTVMWPLRAAGKRLVQNSIAKSAAESLADMRDAAAELFRSRKLDLGQAVRAAQQRAAVEASDLAQDIARRREALRVDLLTNTIRPAKAGLVAAKDAAAAEEARLLETHDPLIAAARERAKTSVSGAEAARTAALDAERAAHEAMLQRASPSTSAAGRSVAEMFEKAQAQKQQLGQAVDDAATTGPFRDITALKAEAARIQRDELLPRTFHSDPAAKAVDAILAEPNVASFERLHQLKKELQDAIRGSYDKAAKTQMEGATQHLTKQLRETLSGYEPYDLATKAYADIITRYTGPVAKTIRRTARTSPEEIALMINVNRPTQARVLTELMTEGAEAGGAAAGGRKALENVQDVWFYKNVLEGSLETLGERLDKLERNPEFVKHFLSDSRMKTLLTRTRELAKSYPELNALHQARIDAAKLAGEQGITAAQAAKQTALDQGKTRSAAEIRKATEAVTKATDDANAAKAAARAGHRGEAARLRQTHAATIEAARQAKETATSPRLDEVTEALKRLDRSTLGGSNLRSPVQVAADIANVVMRPLGTAFAGLSLARMALGASDADIARYVIYGKQPVKMLTKTFVTSTLGRAAPAVASQPVKSLIQSRTRQDKPPDEGLTVSLPPSGQRRTGPPPAPPAGRGRGGR